ncbi:hypothetical protein [Actinopolymorpha pittospori]
MSNRHRAGNPKERLAGVYTTTLDTRAEGAAPQAKVPTTHTAHITGRRERLVARTQ